MKKFTCFLMLVCFILFSSGCIEKNVQTNKSNDQGYIVYDTVKCPNDLIMTNNYDLNEQYLLVNLFQGLVRMDSDGKIVPAIAQSWNASENQTCYTFKIRNDARWSNGSNITASDFVEFFKKFFKEGKGSLYVERLHCIFGVQDYENGIKDFSNVAIKALDKKTLEIRLNYSCNYFLNILSEPIYNLRKIDNKLKDWKNKYNDILYTGYFVVDNFSKNSSISLSKNKYYWNKNNVKSNRILITLSTVKEASLANFESNLINVFTDPPESETKELITSGSAVKYEGNVGNALIFNPKNNDIINDINLRKAITECIDRNYIVKDILNDSVRPSLAYIPENISDGLNGKYINKSFFDINSNKDAAQNDFKESLYAQNVRNLKFIYLDADDNRKVCDSIAKSLKDTLGLTVECEGYQKEEFQDQIKKGNYDIAKINYAPGYNYPLAFLELWTSDSKSNVYGYRNLEYDSEVSQGKTELDRDKQINFFRNSENILIGDMIVIPLYFDNTIVCKKNKVNGIYINQNGNLIFDKTYFKK
ncbi:peptide ABC transporter substrate-binding protein [Clostridium fermenticellae]|uniref:Peptide ABC transporter substrate-binding protein n=1 Tax=Clostridium fermenticellae TaxID=2068654 RepID=A0A386H1Z0_9CLOT|nr:peptide ABC transporter substrate-binding protein [Clostridium fermenticellae]AYD39588.1 peptide ABC transporter substrate-binding protein [Clostridium fermenticellae]